MNRAVGQRGVGLGRRAGIMLVALLLLAGCASRGGPVPYDVASFGRPDLPTVAATEASYRVGAGDVLAVSVLNVAEYSGDFTVDPRGQFEMPLIGKVDAQNKTTDELSRALEARLGERYLRSPRVLVTVKSSPGQKITVDGAVTQAGIYPLSGPTTLIQALALARGLDDDANPRRVVVFRTINGQRQAAAFDLVDIRQAKTPDPAVYANDVVIVDGQRARKAFRDFVSSIPIFSVFRPF